MATSVRLDPATESLLLRLARRRGTSKSWIIRESLALYGRREFEPPRAGKPRPYDLVRHLLGSVEGPGDLSTRAREYFDEYVRAKHGARRPR